MDNLNAFTRRKRSSHVLEINSLHECAWRMPEFNSCRAIFDSYVPHLSIICFEELDIHASITIEWITHWTWISTPFCSISNDFYILEFKIVCPLSIDAFAIGRMVYDYITNLHIWLGDSESIVRVRWSCDDHILNHSTFLPDMNRFRFFQSSANISVLLN